MPQIPEKILLEAKVIAMGEEVEPSNDIYQSLKMVFLTSELNLNGIEFTEAWIKGVAEQKDKYITIPLVADVSALEKGQYDKLTHKFNKKTGQFKTQAIGAFYNFEVNKNGSVLELIAYARVWKRNSAICAALEELYSSAEGLKFSYEVLIGKYSFDSGKKIIDKDDSNNPIGSCVVSTPAVPASKAQLLIAQAYEHDFIDNLNLGGDNLERNKNLSQEQFFANVKLHFENAELDISQVQRKVYNKLKSEMKEDYWEWEAVDMGVNFVVMKNWYSADLMRVDFSVGEDDVEIIEKYEVNKIYVRKKSKEDNEMATIAELEAKITANLAEIDNLKTQIASKDTELASKIEIITTKETELTTATEKLNTLSASVLEKDNELTILQAAKTELDAIKAKNLEVEQAEKKELMKTKYSKLLSAEVMKTTEVAEAIENLNESMLQAKVTELALAAAEKNATNTPAKTPTLASRITDNIEIAGSGSDSLKSKYSL